MSAEAPCMGGLTKRLRVILFSGGGNEAAIREFEYVGSDISDIMNEGAAALHSDIKMLFSTKGTISGVLEEITEDFGKKLSLFYGLGVSIRYAVRDAVDLVKAADVSELSLYNRLSLNFSGETLVSVYGTGKSVYIVSLPKLVGGLKEKGISAKYCTANMQFGKDGEGTLRASIVISRKKEMLNKFIGIYDDCIDKSIQVAGVKKGVWRDLEELLIQGK